MNYEEAVSYIEEIPKFTKMHPLEHVRDFIKRLGEPGLKKRVIHVAGTNGKGSVCVYVKAILEAEGRRTGLFTSPHLLKLNERICICGTDISDEEFMAVFARAKEVAGAMEKEGAGHPSYFEFLFGMAMQAFERADIEYVILETGLGGRLDATNVVEKPLITIITSIGFDHTAVLGETIGAIAAEKAGIVKPGVPLICDGNNEQALTVIKAKAKRSGCWCREIAKNAFEIREIMDKDIAFSIRSAYYEDIVWKLRGTGIYQPMNAVLALEAMRYLSKQEKFCESLQEWAAALALVNWPGRMEEVLPGVIVDGGHNTEAVKEVVAGIRKQKKNRPRIILYAAVGDKNYVEAAGFLGNHAEADMIVTTRLADSRGVEAEELAAIFRNSTSCQVTAKEQVKEAFHYALDQKGKDGILYCLGSLYLVGEIKAVLGEEL